MNGFILVINPGSTSTKVALFTENDLAAGQILQHTAEELRKFPNLMEQKEFRKQLILEFMNEQTITPRDLQAVVGRGGLLAPIPGGTYLVDETMLEDLREERYQSHASNLGAILADDIARMAGVPAYIVDPVVVDELQPLARISGLNGIERRSIAHVLNQKAVARKVLNERGQRYEESAVIVAHLGGGISIGAHQNGRMIDVVNGLDGEGPYSPERTGTLPLYPFAKKLINEHLAIAQVKILLAGKGGLVSYLGETDIRQIEERIAQGEHDAQLYLDGMIYQTAKAIGEMAVVLNGRVDCIILTGGAAHSVGVVQGIDQRVSWIAPVKVVPGQMEMKALYEGVRRVLKGEEEAKRYSQIILEETR